MHSLKKRDNRYYTKKKIEKEYPYLSVSERKHILNNIISKVRKIDIEVAKRQKKLRPKEVDAFRLEMDDLYLDE